MPKRDVLLLSVALLLWTAPVRDAAAQKTELRGAWSAVANGRTLGGTWTAQARSDPLVAWGTWEALNEADEIVAAGSWSASKAGREWRGSWKARVGAGGTLSGEWKARDSSAGFLEMLRAAARNPLSGTFQTGNVTGSFSIRTEAQ